MAITSNWLRWNTVSHIFEYSTDNGATYVPLPLNASILNEGTVSPGVLPPSGVTGQIPSTANALARWADATGKLLNNSTILVDNAGGVTFPSYIDVTGGTGTSYDVAPIEIRTVNTPRLSFHWPGVVASQIGMDSAGVIRTYDNPGTGYAAFACGAISCAGITATTISATGQCNLGNMVVAGNIQTSAGYMYPGRIDSAGAGQGSWYLASHASYGLYSNTGLYLAAGITCTTVTCSGAITCTNITPSGTIYAVGIGSAAPNFTATIASDNYLRKSTSSERFKEDIRRSWTNPQREALLGISPILYKDKGHPEWGDYLGFSAEELDAAGLKLWVIYEADGKPAAIREHALLASFLDFLKDHERRIAALENKEIS